MLTSGNFDNIRVDREQEEEKRGREGKEITGASVDVYVICVGLCRTEEGKEMLGGPHPLSTDTFPSIFSTAHPL